MGSGQPSGRLTSWKQIARYLQCEERTAQRWEQERGLPVHRIPGEKRGSVYAFEAEIAAWLAQQPLQRPESSSENHGTEHPARRLPSFAIPLTVSASILVVTALLFLVWAKRATQADVRRPASASYLGPFLIVKDREGNELWRHKFPADLHVPDEKPEPWRHVRFVDIDGDGLVETLAAVGYVRHSGNLRNTQTELLCFASDGELRWRFTPNEALMFAEKTYAPPFQVLTMFIQGDAEKNIWVAFVHNPWWPTILVRLDARGRETARFVNAGYIYALAELKNAAGHFILAGGVNNEYDAGMLAVLRADSPNGVSPQTAGSAYECQNCPAGSPYQYFIFPRSELNRLTPSAYNKVASIEILERRIKLLTMEVLEDPRGNTEAIFEFSRDFELLSAQPGDSYWNLHRVLEQADVVKHSAQSCPDRSNFTTPRVWKEGQWSDALLVSAHSRSSSE